MNESSLIYQIDPIEKDTEYNELFELLYKSEILKKFSFEQIPFPVLRFREDFLEYIAKNGLFSLYNLTLSCEDITSKSMNIDQIEKVIFKFLANLKQANQLIIIDPYIYKTMGNDVQLFEKAIKEIASDNHCLNEIIFVTPEKNNENKELIHKAVQKVIPEIEIREFNTDIIHDRFWIDINNKIGIVMGTSFNGIGKEMALIDKISESDVNQIIEELKNSGLII